MKPKKCAKKDCGAEFVPRWPLQRCCSAGCEAEVRRRKGLRENARISRKSRIAPSDRQRAYVEGIKAVKGEIREERAAVCESCGCGNGLDPSHCVPVSLRKDLGLVKEGIFLQCRSCHEAWEHVSAERVLLFLNLRVMLLFLWRYDRKRYWHVMFRLADFDPVRAEGFAVEED